MLQSLIGKKKTSCCCKNFLPIAFQQHFCAAALMSLRFGLLSPKFVGCSGIHYPSIRLNAFENEFHVHLCMLLWPCHFAASKENSSAQPCNHHTPPTLLPTPPLCKAFTSELAAQNPSKTSSHTGLLYPSEY